MKIDYYHCYPRNSDVLCQGCSNNQEMITHMMAEFDVPSNMENEAYFVKEAEIFRRELEKRYPLCLHCQRRVDDTLRKQAFAFRGKLLDHLKQLCSPQDAPVRRNTSGFMII